ERMRQRRSAWHRAEVLGQLAEQSIRPGIRMDGPDETKTHHETETLPEHMTLLPRCDSASRSARLASRHNCGRVGPIVLIAFGIVSVKPRRQEIPGDIHRMADLSCTPVGIAILPTSRIIDSKEDRKNGEVISHWS